MRTCFAFLILLILAASAYPQPWGPLEILTANISEQNLHSPQIAIIDSQTARIFYTLDIPGQSEIRTVLYDLLNHQIVGSPEIARTDTVSLNLLDAEVDGAAAWIAVYKVLPNPSWVYTKYLIGPAGGGLEGLIGRTGSPSVPWLPSYNLSDFDLIRRTGGGWILSWVQVWTIGPYWEDVSQISVSGINSGSVEYVQPLIPQNDQLFGPYYASVVSTVHDTTLVLTRRIWNQEWPGSYMLLRAVAGADSEILDTVCTYDCDINMLQMRQASNGSLLVYSDPNTLVRINESRGCEVLGSLSPGSAPADIAFRASFGFASIWINSSWIQVGRMHENGLIVEPGVIFWRDEEHAIRHASVAVSTDGKIYVVWTDASSTEIRLMISRIDWDTPLSTRDPHFILHPSSLILSSYPNPFNAETRIQFSLPREERIEMKVFNVQGRLVSTLANDRFPAGTHSVSFDGSNLSSGIYLCRLQAGSVVRTHKLMLMK